MRPHHSQSSCENAILSNGTLPLASYKELPPRKVKKFMNENTEHYNECSKRERWGIPLLVYELSSDGGLQKDEA